MIVENTATPPGMPFLYRLSLRLRLRLSSAPAQPQLAQAAGSSARASSGGNDAWAQSLAKFSSLQGLADDFLAADTAKTAAGTGTCSSAGSCIEAGISALGVRSISPRS
mmetsp:Transcript_9976/g.21566  ORF Transcript_9976/g.21566 Transcript_9976/m.21566 type:complete len:109 (+) Transcript_9976:354-680(+)